MQGLSYFIFLSTLSLRRATLLSSFIIVYVKISIHALLAESDVRPTGDQPSTPDFYPRSPCGERLLQDSLSVQGRNFYPRSPCGERHPLKATKFNSFHISIHALLAESDLILHMARLMELLFLSTLSLRRATLAGPSGPAFLYNFYPRSPCGERPDKDADWVRVYVFLSTLSLRRATSILLTRKPENVLFLSTLSLRRATLPTLRVFIGGLFLSTLSLRRATLLALLCNLLHDHFYPRSPCGERRRGAASCYLDNIISIHALLAESDSMMQSMAAIPILFLSTLSLRRATVSHQHLSSDFWDFYPRSPCGERRYLINTYHRIFGISIHALLAESDGISSTLIIGFLGFLSTLSLRRATV